MADSRKGIKRERISKKSTSEDRSAQKPDYAGETDKKPVRKRTSANQSSGKKPERSSSDRPFKSDDRKRTTRERPERSSPDKPFKSDDRKRTTRERPERSSSDRPFKSDNRKRTTRERPERSSPDRPFKSDDRKRTTRERPERSSSDRPFKSDDRKRTTRERPERSSPDRPFKSDDRKRTTRERPERSSSDRPFKSDDRKRTTRERPERSSSDRPFKSDDRKRAPRERPESRGEAGFRAGKPTRNYSKSRSGGSDDLIRLNRYISNAGICSRRKADELIEAGEVSVNDKIVTELGHKVNLSDKVKVSGRLIKREQKVTILLNKPKDYITTTDDPQERKTVMELVKGATKERIYPVGRLDRNTTGLLILTNDGELAQKLAHPKNGVRKLYHVTLNKALTKTHMTQIAEGIELEDGIARVDDISYIEGESKKEIGIELHIGKNRIVRRIFEQLGYDVEKLDRVIYAGLTKKDLPRGKWRFLTEKEIILLRHFSV